MTEQLPTLYPTTRSGRKIQIPKRIWGSAFFCIEYPNGIMIDKYGVPQPDRMVPIPCDRNVEVCIGSGLESLSKEERREQRNLRDDVKCKSENSVYYNDEDYVDDESDESIDDQTTTESESGSEVDDDTDDETDYAASSDEHTDEDAEAYEEDSTLQDRETVVDDDETTREQLRMSQDRETVAEDDEPENTRLRTPQDQKTVIVDDEQERKRPRTPQDQETVVEDNAPESKRLKSSGSTVCVQEVCE